MSESLAPRHSSIDALALRTRGYQYEMFERSLKGNVIVAVRLIILLSCFSQY